MGIFRRTINLKDIKDSRLAIRNLGQKKNVIDKELIKFTIIWIDKNSTYDLCREDQATGDKLDKRVYIEKASWIDQWTSVSF
jgi:hypothetical protein